MRVLRVGGLKKAGKQLLVSYRIVFVSIILVFVLAGLIRISKNERNAKIAFLGYVLAVLLITLFFRRFDRDISVQFNPFQKYLYLTKAFASDVRESGFSGVIRFLKYKETTITEILLNILLFMPLGYLVPVIHERFDRLWRIVLLGILFSLSIEMTQYATHLGCFDASDLMHNTIGSGFGYLLYRKWIFIKKPGE